MKAIWLQIAKAEINADPSATGELLQLSEGLLTVADVLQFFPEFATIDHFKQALCSSLEAVSKEIDEYQEKLGLYIEHELSYMMNLKTKFRIL